MNQSRPQNRKPRVAAPSAELLEDRKLMTGGVGDTFAIMPATITKAGGHATVSFNLSPSLFTDKGNKPFVLGIDIAAGTGSSALPKVLSVTTPTGKTLSVAHAAFDASVKKTGASASNTVSSAGLVTIPGITGKLVKSTTKGGAATQSYVYKVNVETTGKTSGAVLVGFYLPGDADGSGVVNQVDLNAITYGLGTNANDTTGKYSFDADVDRNGVINAADMAIARKNLGIGTTVSPVISANLDPGSVSDAKNRITSNSSVLITGAATPGATIAYTATGVPTTTAIADTTGNYKVNLPLNTGANTFNVVATDGFDQKITGSIASITRD